MLPLGVKTRHNKANKVVYSKLQNCDDIISKALCNKTINIFNLVHDS